MVWTWTVKQTAVWPKCSPLKPIEGRGDWEAQPSVWAQLLLNKAFPRCSSRHSCWDIKLWFITSKMLRRSPSVIKPEAGTRLKWNYCSVEHAVIVSDSWELLMFKISSNVLSLFPFVSSINSIPVIKYFHHLECQTLFQTMTLTLGLI